MIRAGKTFIVSLAASAFILSYVSGASAETFYRWNDDRGNPVHSDRPPPKGVDYEVVSTNSTLIRPVEANQGAVPRKIEPTVSNDFDTVDTRKPMMEKNSAYCAQARENLQALDTFARIRVRNDQGEFIYIDEEQKAIQRQQALDTIEAHCE